MNSPRYLGRSGAVWRVEDVLLRPGHLRPADGRPEAHSLPHQVDLVYNETGHNYGALRRFPDRTRRAEAVAVLARAAPCTPVLLDLVDHHALPPSLVTSWVPGASDAPLAELRERDDLLHAIEQGTRWRPAEALRLLVPLGQALDDLARDGFVPVELSPDHLVHNEGSLSLVGLSRHTYRPDAGTYPAAAGMSLPTAQLLDEDHPPAGAPLPVWREYQRRALLRLAGWMAGGLPPSSWGPITSDADLTRYLEHAGFAGELPRLVPGRLADTLVRAADQEERHAAGARIDRAAAVVVYDNRASERGREGDWPWMARHVGQTLEGTVKYTRSGWVVVRVPVERARPWEVNVPVHRTTAAPRVSPDDLTRLYPPGTAVAVTLNQVGERTTNDGRSVPRLVGSLLDPGTPSPVTPARNLDRVSLNPESVRLGLLTEHGPDVLAVAAFPRREEAANDLASLLAGAGWLLVDPDELKDVLAQIVERNPGARYVLVGHAEDRLAEVLPEHREVVLPGSAHPTPTIAFRPADELPYADDPRLEQFAAEFFDRAGGGGRGGKALRRRSFAVGWAVAYDPSVREKVTAAATDKGWRQRLGNSVVELPQHFPDDTELLLKVRLHLNGPVFTHGYTRQVAENVRRAAPILRSLPAGALRDAILRALLGSTYEELHSVVTRYVLPVATDLHRVFDPTLTIGGVRFDDALLTKEGVRRLGLLGRLAVALPHRTAEDLVAYVDRVPDDTVLALIDTPALSLAEALVGIRTERQNDVVGGTIRAEDADLLARYGPAAWRTLLDEGSAHHLRELGPAWALVAERDESRAPEPEFVVELARAARVAPRYAVRALLNTDPEHWPLVRREAALAARWLAESGDLDLAPVLAACPRPEDLVGRLGVATLRAAVAACHDRRSLERAEAVAARVGVPYDEFVRALVAGGIPVGGRGGLDDPATEAWLAAALAEGTDAEQALGEWGRLCADPGRLREVAVDGRDLPRRVIAGLVGEHDLASLAVDAVTAAALLVAVERDRGVLRLLPSLFLPSQRLTALRLTAHAVTAGIPGPGQLPDADALRAVVGAADPEAELRARTAPAR